jgi:hypothetical protein
MESSRSWNANENASRYPPDLSEDAAQLVLKQVEKSKTNLDD